MKGCFLEYNNACVGPQGMFDGVHVFVCWAPGVVQLNTRIVVLGGRGCHSEYTYVCVGAQEVNI